ncbi:MAG TPA: alpha/beta hydrolase [Candidatus Binatia bacterium]|nr:alpha/beta hydrolase [Candidatus Binatia bacterium]
MGKHARVFFLLLAVLPHGGCADFAKRAAVTFFYREADLPQQQVYKDLAYWSDPLAHPRKHRLDFFVPQGGRWPVLIFVHGGAWRRGDKALEFGGVDPYGNIGRFYAARGVGVAVINYRLQPAVTWREQILDVARAMVWVFEHADYYGADKHAVFLFGHSSGAHLVARTALDHELLRKAGVPLGLPCGVIAVSGAPYDIADEKTYELGTSRTRFERPFRAGQGNDRWKYDASPLHFVAPSASPFLLLHGAWETRGLKRQNQIMAAALQNAGVPNRLVEAGWDGHFLIVASLSRPDTQASAAVLEFIRASKCA